jgi:hypothetical protein
MSCIASRLVNFDFEFLEVPNEVFTALISRAGDNYESVFQAFNHFFVVGVIDEISSIIKQYSKAGTDAIIIAKESRFTLDFFVDFIGCKIRASPKRFLFL